MQIAQRMDTRRTAPEAHRALLDFDAVVSFDPALRELVRTRASLVNGFIYCIDQHTRDAVAAGESEQRLFALAAWEGSSLFTERERAALGLTDAVTLVGDGHVPDSVYAEAAKHFDDEELAQLLFAIVAINALNRLAIATRKTPRARPG